MVYGYTRHIKGCDMAGQEHCRKLREAGAREVRCDIFTGLRNDRPELERLMGALTAGDTIAVHGIDCLGSSLQEVSGIVERAVSAGAAVHVLPIGRISGQSTERQLLACLKACAEFESSALQRRSAEGRAVAGAHGMQDGRRPKYTRAQRDHAMDLLRDHSYSQVSRMTGISRATLVREKQRRKTL